jgi:hypothetical protein
VIVNQKIISIIQSSAQVPQVNVVLELISMP